MPILEVEIVIRPSEVLHPQSLVSELANRAGDIFLAAPGTTWVKLRALGSEYYAENGCAAGEYFPVFVTVLKASLPDPSTMQREIAALTAAVAQACGRPPENVHIFYLPAAAGRAAFGGKWVPDAS